MLTGMTSFHRPGIRAACDACNSTSRPTSAGIRVRLRRRAKAIASSRSRSPTTRRLRTRDSRRSGRMTSRDARPSWSRIIRERDPDVIEGHNLFRADMEYLEQRARRLGIKLALGRDGSAMYARPARLQIAERTIAYRRYDVYGRNLVDTWILAQHYDIASRELEGFDWTARRAFRVRACRPRPTSSRIGSAIISITERETLFQSALEEVRATREVAKRLSAQLLRAGADFSVFVSKRDSARERDQDRLACCCAPISRRTIRFRLRGEPMHSPADTPRCGRWASRAMFCIATSPRCTRR